uniref:Uncharacterized protein n=1 Tax=Serinus canaria TaxID=9135 RepID=A0A8C9MPV0_SERCA
APDLWLSSVLLQGKGRMNGVAPNADRSIFPLLRNRIAPTGDRNISPLLWNGVAPTGDRNISPLLWNGIAPTGDRNISPLLRHGVCPVGDSYSLPLLRHVVSPTGDSSPENSPRWVLPIAVSFRKRLFQCGSTPRSQILPAILLQSGLLFPRVHRSCQKPAPAQASHGVTASFRHPPALAWAPPQAAGGSLHPRGPPWAVGAQLVNRRINQHCPHLSVTNTAHPSTEVPCSSSPPACLH